MATANIRAGDIINQVHQKGGIKMTYQANNTNESRFFKHKCKCTLIVPPKIETLMTGVYMIYAKHDKFCLVYTDGTIEEAICPKAIGQKFMAIVGEIQGMRD